MARRKNRVFVYEQERKGWLDLLTGDDRNSVRLQLYAMAWDLAAFVIRLAPRNSDGTTEFPPLIFNLVRVGFYANLFISIRRLIDERNDVVSLTRVLKDMKRKASCVTRSAILAAEGIPYDFLPAKQKQDALLMEAMPSSPGGIYIPPEIDWETFADRHQTIDRLTSTTEGTRNPSDHVPKRLFENLIEWISRAANEASSYANQFVAHAAESGHPERVKIEQISISHGKLVECYKCFCSVFNFIRGEILGSGSGPLLPFPTDNHLAYIDAPLVKTENVTKLREKWEQMQNESLKLSSWTVEDYERKFNTNNDS